MSLPGLRFETKSHPPTLRYLEKFHHDTGFVASPENLSVALQASAGIRWLYAIHSGKEIGIARLQFYGQDFCYISELMVRKKMQRKGVGSFLLNEIERLCRANGVALACLEPANNSAEFYSRNGYSWAPTVPPTLFKDFRESAC